MSWSNFFGTLLFSAATVRFIYALQGYIELCIEKIDIGIDIGIGKKVKYRINIISKEKAGIAHP